MFVLKSPSDCNYVVYISIARRKCYVNASYSVPASRFYFLTLAFPIELELEEYAGMRPEGQYQSACNTYRRHCFAGA
jgi:hypothetical protein